MKKLLLLLLLLLIPSLAFAQFTVPQGGTGSTTLTGILLGNGTSKLRTLTIGTNLTLSGTTLNASGGGSSFSYLFPSDATTTVLTLSNGASIPKLTNLTTNGFVKTGSANGTLSIDTSTYLTGNQSITLSGAVTGSGATAITTAFGTASANTVLANGTGATAVPTFTATSSLFQNASATASGLLTSTDWSTFNSKGSGTVTSVATNNGLTGGTITNTGTIGLASIAANSVLANSTGAAGVPSAVATSSLFQTASATLSGLLSSTDWSTFNGKQAAISATWPITLSGAAVGFNGLSTSTAAVVGNIPYYSGVNTFANVATSSVSCTSASGVTCTGFNRVGAGGDTIALSAIPNASLAFSTISGVALGNTLAALTAGTTLTSGGTYTGNTARTFDIDLTHPNTWTGLQQFALASSTQFSAASQTFYIDSTGHVLAKDTVNAWSGVISPSRAFVLSTGTTTTWTGTTSAAYVPSLVMPFAGTLRDMRCLASTTQAFLGVAPRINGTATSPSYTVASTTVGQTKFTANNTFTAGQRIDLFVGTTTSDANATGVSCTFQVTES